MLVAAAGVIAGSTALLLALLFAMGVEAAFFGPIKYAILPDLLAPDELLLGNALIEAGTFLAILLGTIAGMLIATGHGEITVAILIIVVALAAWGASLMIPPTAPAAGPAPFQWNFLHATGRLIATAAERPVPFRSMLGISWFWLVGALYLSQFPSYVRFVLGSEEIVVTLFLAVFSVGVGAGSILCNRLLRGKISARTVPWGMLGLALFSIDLWLASPAPSASAGLSLIADFFAVPGNWRILADLFGDVSTGRSHRQRLDDEDLDNYRQVFREFLAEVRGYCRRHSLGLLQTASDERRRARTIGANNVINAAAMVLSAILTMALVAAGISVPGLFLILGIASLPVAALFWRLAPHFSTSPEAARLEASET